MSKALIEATCLTYYSRERSREQSGAIQFENCIQGHTSKPIQISLDFLGELIFLGDSNVPEDHTISNCVGCECVEWIVCPPVRLDTIRYAIGRAERLCLPEMARSATSFHLPDRSSQSHRKVHILLVKQRVGSWSTMGYGCFWRKFESNSSYGWVFTTSTGLLILVQVPVLIIATS
jgi:hypothetical protein